MILTDAILLLTPGFLTDLLGISMLIPFTRKLYVDMTLTYFKKKFQTGQWQGQIKGQARRRFGLINRRGLIHQTRNSSHGSQPADHDQQERRGNNILV